VSAQLDCARGTRGNRAKAGPAAAFVDYELLSGAVSAADPRDIRGRRKSPHSGREVKRKYKLHLVRGTRGGTPPRQPQWRTRDGGNSISLTKFQREIVVETRTDRALFPSSLPVGDSDRVEIPGARGSRRNDARERAAAVWSSVVSFLVNINSPAPPIRA